MNYYNPYHQKSHRTNDHNRPYAPVRRYSVTIEGQTFVRNSPVVFTHLVVGRKGEGRIESLKWSKSAEEAQKGAEFHSSVGYSDVQVIAVTVSQYKREIR